VTVVVISSSEKGDRLVESLDVKAPVAGEKSWSDPSEGRVTGQAVANANQ
jgi:hypothetical protein